MRNLVVGSVLFLSLTVLVSASTADPVLWYMHPAQRWGDALPIGNGRLGGMVFGGVVQERIQLNEDTIWNGRTRDRINPQGLKSLPEVRRLLFAGKPLDAEAWQPSCRAVLMFRNLGSQLRCELFIADFCVFHC
jgi:alpha-L-fucosidase 2